MQRKAQKRDQLYETLKAAISGGQYASGSRLPKEVEFAEKLGVSRKTLRHALERLENDHLIERIRSKGTFVRFRRSGFIQAPVCRYEEMRWRQLCRSAVC